MRSFVRIAMVLVASFLVAHPAVAEEAKKPPAQYLVSVSTDNTAMPGMAAGQGGGLGGMMASLLTGGLGGGAQRSLWLDLLGPETPPAPVAEHQIPPGLKMGKSLPLLTPAAVKTDRAEASSEEGPREDVKILFYWGCGEEIRPGQPKVLDTAKMSAADFSQVPVARKGSSVVRLSPRQGWTYGEWPNRETRSQVPGDGSLAGHHLIKGNYTPDIEFSLEQRQDFMEPVVFTRSEGALADAIRLGWQTVPNATGYFMMATGGSSNAKEVVMWNSSELQEMGGGLMNYVPPGTVQKYIKEKVVLPPDATSCTIPKGIFKTAEGAVLMFIAYGNEANFAQPPKPADPKVPWNPIWTAKVRFKSTGMLPLGMDMKEMDGESGEKKPAAAERKDAGQTSPGGEETDPLKGVKDGAKKLKGIFGF